MTEWQRLRLGTALSVRHGFPFRGEYFRNEGSLIVLTPGNFFSSGGFKPKSGVEKYYNGPLPEGYILSRGQVVIAMTEQAVGLLGSSATIPTGDVYLHNQRIGLVNIFDTDRLDLRFVYHLFNSPTLRQRIQATATGAKVRHTAPERIHAIEVSVPGINTQRRISDILDALDDLIENNLRRIELLNEMARAIYREWFVDFRYPGHENDEFFDSSIGPIPSSWLVSTVGKEARNFDRTRRPLSGRERQKRPGRYVYYGAAKPLDLIDGYLFDGDYLLVAEDGSVITTNGFPVLQRVRGKFWVSNHAHVLQGGERISTTYLERALERYSIAGHVTGAAQPKVTQANLNRIPILVPPKSIILAEAQTTESMVQEFFALDEANVHLHQIKNLLLPQLVTGQIDVSHVDLDAILTEAAG